MTLKVPRGGRRRPGGKWIVEKVGKVGKEVKKNGQGKEGRDEGNEVEGITIGTREKT